MRLIHFAGGSKFMPDKRKPKKIKQQLQTGLDAIKIEAQRNYEKAMHHAELELKKQQQVVGERLDRVDRWALHHVDEALDKATEEFNRAKGVAKKKYDRAIAEAQGSLQKNLKQAGSDVGKKIGKISDRLKDAAQSAWQKLVD
jgi:vacuolar-type H+-ATPase subunit E/Vma4